MARDARDDITTCKVRSSVRIRSCSAVLVDEMTNDRFWGHQGPKDVAYPLEPDRAGCESRLHPLLTVWTLFK